ncbi:hypothetical protein WMF04_29940 [Sorangium sp. So ce260]|uniref:hypothetical protein n=1 Tax=Sorangium sp. So ce260 TaxID=3133291 RepID=UPI003F5E6095
MKDEAPALGVRLILEEDATSRAETHRCFTRQRIQYAPNREVYVGSDEPEEQQSSIDAAFRVFAARAF